MPKIIYALFSSFDKKIAKSIIINIALIFPKITNGYALNTICLNIPDIAIIATIKGIIRKSSLTKKM